MAGTRAKGAPQTERTVPEARVCEFCGAALVRRRPQARHCGDRCRTAARRELRLQRLVAHLDTIQNAVNALRNECLGTARGQTDR